MSQNRGSISNIDVIGSSSTPQNDPTPSQSKSSMKGHIGSRPLRERTKERKVRLKPNSQRPSLRREQNLEKLSQDSESAYHTHEASDSFADKSSLEHGSNGCDLRDTLLDNKLDISPRIVVSSSVDAKVKAFLKKNESQESDFPKDSNSDDDKLAIDENDCEKSKRHSQSISSEEEEDVLQVNICKNGKVTGHETKYSNDVQDKELVVNDGTLLNNKIKFEGHSHVESSSETAVQDLSKSNLNNKLDKSNILNSSHINVDLDIAADKISVNEKTANGDSESSFIDISIENSLENRNDACDITKETKDVSSQKRALKTSYPSNLKLECQNGFQSMSAQGPNLNTHSGSSVHFTQDLVQLREITPKSSREGTPTHTQSDVLLQTKRSVRGNGLCNSDTESESDNNIASNKILPNVRRRKMNLPDSTEVGGTILRNRRHMSLNIRDSKTHSTTGVSSSDGETEGTEYSRSSRRVNLL